MTQADATQLLHCAEFTYVNARCRSTQDIALQALNVALTQARLAGVSESMIAAARVCVENLRDNS